MKFAATGVAVIGMAAIFTVPAYHAFRQPCDPGDTAPSQLAHFQSHAGADPTDEYTPITADNDALKSKAPPYWLADSPEAPAPAAAPPGSAPLHLTLSAPHAEVLILNLRDYPAWRIRLNGVLTPHPAHRDDGLIAIPIPAGASTIDIRYAQSVDQIFGDGIAPLALALFLIGLRRELPRLVGRRLSRLE
jgi:hypothetical protein